MGGVFTDVTGIPHVAVLPAGCKRNFGAQRTIERSPGEVLRLEGAHARHTEREHAVAIRWRWDGARRIIEDDHMWTGTWGGQIVREPDIFQADRRRADGTPGREGAVDRLARGVQAENRIAVLIDYER